MWLQESNRKLHLLYAIPIGFIGTILMVIGVAFGMEYKDKLYGQGFDWNDFYATIIGGLIGLIILIILILIIIY